MSVRWWHIALFTAAIVAASSIMLVEPNEMGRLLLDDHDYPLAELTLLQALESRPNDIEVLRNLAAVYAKLSAHESQYHAVNQRIVELLTATDINRVTDADVLRLSDSFQALGRDDEAIAAVRRVIAARSSAASSRNLRDRLARLCQWRGDIVGQVELWEEIRQIDLAPGAQDKPEEDPVYIERAGGRPDGEIVSTATPVLANLLRLRSHWGWLPDLDREWEVLLDIEQRFPASLSLELRTRAAEIAFYRGQAREAAARLERIVAVLPDHWPALSLLISLYYYRGDIDAGLTLQREYAKRRSPNTEPLLAFARDLEQHGMRRDDQTGRLPAEQERRLLEAVDVYHELRAMEPGDAGHIRRIALLHAELEEPRGTVFWARRVLAEYPADTQMLQALVDGLAAIEDWDSLIPAASDLLRYQGYDEGYRPVLAAAFAARRRWAEALAQLDEYHGRGFGGPQSRLVYAGYLTAAGKADLAVAAYRALIRDHSPASSPSSAQLWVEPRLSLGFLLLDRAAACSEGAERIANLVAATAQLTPEARARVFRASSAELDAIAGTRIVLRLAGPTAQAVQQLDALELALRDEARRGRIDALDVFEPLLSAAASGRVQVHAAPAADGEERGGILESDRRSAESACVYAAMELGWSAEAAVRAQSLLERDPENSAILRTLAHALEASGAGEQALTIWEAESGRRPGDPEVYRSWFDLLVSLAGPPASQSPAAHAAREERLRAADAVMARWTAQVPAPLTLSRAYWYAIERGQLRRAAALLEAHLALLPFEEDWQAILREEAATAGEPFRRPRSRWRDAVDLYRTLGLRDREHRATTMLIAGSAADPELIAGLAHENEQHDPAFALNLLELIASDPRYTEVAATMRARIFVSARQATMGPQPLLPSPSGPIRLTPGLREQVRLALLDREVDAIQSALALSPAHAGLLTLLGDALAQRGELARAYTVYAKAEAIAADAASAARTAVAALALRGSAIVPIALRSAALDEEQLAAVRTALFDLAAALGRWNEIPARGRALGPLNAASLTKRTTARAWADAMMANLSRARTLAYARLQLANDTQAFADALDTMPGVVYRWQRAEEERDLPEAARSRAELRRLCGSPAIAEAARNSLLAAIGDGHARAGAEIAAWISRARREERLWRAEALPLYRDAVALQDQTPLPAAREEAAAEKAERTAQTAALAGLAYDLRAADAEALQLRLLELEPGNVWALIRLADLAEIRGAPLADAAAWIVKALALPPSGEDALTPQQRLDFLMRSADLWFRAGETERARDAYRDHILQVGPTLDAASGLLACEERLHPRDGDAPLDPALHQAFAAVRAVTDEAIAAAVWRNEPDAAAARRREREILRLASYARLALGDRSGAIDVLRLLAARFASEDVDPYRWGFVESFRVDLAEALADAGLAQEAADAIAPLGTRTDVWRLPAVAGRIALMLGDHGESIEAYTAQIDALPAPAPDTDAVTRPIRMGAIEGLGFAQLAGGRWAEARERFTEALTLDPAARSAEAARTEIDWDYAPRLTFGYTSLARSADQSGTGLSLEFRQWLSQDWLMRIDALQEHQAGKRIDTPPAPEGVSFGVNRQTLAARFTWPAWRGGELTGRIASWDASGAETSFGVTAESWGKTLSWTAALAVNEPWTDPVQAANFDGAQDRLDGSIVWSLSDWMELFGEVNGRIWTLGRGAALGSSGGTFGGGTEVSGGVRFLWQWTEGANAGRFALTGVYSSQRYTSDLVLSQLVSVPDRQDVIGALAVLETSGPGLTWTLNGGLFYDLTNAKMAAEIGGKLRYEVRESGWSVEAGFSYAQDVAGLSPGFRREFTLGGSYRFRAE